MIFNHTKGFSAVVGILCKFAINNIDMKVKVILIS